ncbi:MAG: hypothetical protein ABI912_02040 [Actinomycetota bacterium]
MRSISSTGTNGRHAKRRIGRTTWVSITAALAIVAGSLANGAPAAGGTHVVPPSPAMQKGPIDGLPPAALQQLKSAKLAQPKGATPTTSVTAPAGSLVDPIDMRVLVLATKGDPNPDGVHVVPGGSWDWNLSTMTVAMDYLGVPYDTYKSTTKELCSGGSWRLDWAANPAATDTSCSTGRVTSWPGVAQATLWDGGVHAYYQGVMQTNGTLSYVDANNVFISSALSANEWSALWTFEAQFGIRTVSANTYPTSDFGLTYNGEDGAPSAAKWTSAAASLFPYVNIAGTLPIGNAYTYRATADPLDTTTTVLLTDPVNNALAVVHTYPSQGNRQALALTFDSASYLVHGEVLGYGLVSWVTKGLFLGERHAYLSPQADDLFIANSIWQGQGDAVPTPCGTLPDAPSLPQYRITGGDFRAFVNWQNGRDNPALSKLFRAEFPFNGEGTTPAYLATLGITNDTLTPAVKANQAKFKFVNHTYTHQNLDQRYVDVVVSNTGGTTTISRPDPFFFNTWGHTVIDTVGGAAPAGTVVSNVSLDGKTATLSNPTTLADGATVTLWLGVTYVQATAEIKQNEQAAATLGLAPFNKTNLVQPDISGLTNPNFLQSAYDAGIQYLISDTSRTGDPATYGVNEGRYNSGTYDKTLPGASQAGGNAWNLLEVARYPVNLYFNVNTPARWLAEDNCLYPAGAFGHVNTYQELLDRESSVLARYLLHGHNRPLMVHQPNVTAYDGLHSLLGDLMDATLSKYGNLVNAPIQSLTMDQLAQKQAKRMQYNRALATGAITGSIVPGKTITLRNTSAAAVTVPVTGLNGGVAYGAEKYAGQSISYVTLAAGATVTLKAV